MLRIVSSTLQQKRALKKVSSTTLRQKCAAKKVSRTTLQQKRATKKAFRAVPDLVRTHKVGIYPEKTKEMSI